jgi:[ribosomal protein S5]-alanine N-acetyltransferase
VIETERLVIRPLRHPDRVEMLAQWSDAANERVPADVAEEQVRGWVERLSWGVWERDTGELVGDCSLHFDMGFGEWELSYGFRRDRWGRGYATEAARACVRYGFDSMGVEKIVADVEPAKGASSRVLEKVGFTRVGTLDDGRFLYALTASAWRLRSHPSP